VPSVKFISFKEQKDLNTKQNSFKNKFTNKLSKFKSNITKTINPFLEKHKKLKTKILKIKQYLRDFRILLLIFLPLALWAYIYLTTYLFYTAILSALILFTIIYFWKTTKNFIVLITASLLTYIIIILIFFSFVLIFMKVNENNLPRGLSIFHYFDY